MLWFVVALALLTFCVGVIVGVVLGWRAGEEAEAERCDRWHASRERLRWEDSIKYRGRW